jgi:hypothetical protein
LFRLAAERRAVFIERAEIKTGGAFAHLQRQLPLAEFSRQPPILLLYVIGHFPPSLSDDLHGGQPIKNRFFGLVLNSRARFAVKTDDELSSGAEGPGAPAEENAR